MTDTDELNDLRTLNAQLREKIDVVQDLLDWWGVPRAYQADQPPTLTIYGRLNWLKDAIPNIEAFIQAAKTQNRVETAQDAQNDVLGRGDASC